MGRKASHVSDPQNAKTLILTSKEVNTLKSFIRGADRFFKHMDTLAFIGAAVSVGGMLFCVTLQVIARMTSLMVSWTTELSQYCFLWGTTFASYIAARRKKLIGVELVQNAMPPMIRKGMKFISWFACGFFYALVVYYCFIQLPLLMVQFTPILRWSMGLIYIIMMVGLILLTLYSFYLAVCAFIKDDSAEAKREKTAAEIAEEVE